MTEAVLFENAFKTCTAIHFLGMMTDKRMLARRIKREVRIIGQSGHYEQN